METVVNKLARLCVGMQAVSGENWGFDGCEVTLVIELFSFSSDKEKHNMPHMYNLCD